MMLCMADVFKEVFCKGSKGVGEINERPWEELKSGRRRM